MLKSSSTFTAILLQYFMKTNQEAYPADLFRLHHTASCRPEEKDEHQNNNHYSFQYIFTREDSHH